jgi:hypothetical protein
MLCKAFKFGRLATSQFETRQQQLNEFIATVNVISVPQVTACDEDGPVMFVFYTEKATKAEPALTSKSSKE